MHLSSWLNDKNDEVLKVGVHPSRRLQWRNSTMSRFRRECQPWRAPIKVAQFTTINVDIRGSHTHFTNHYPLTTQMDSSPLRRHSPQAVLFLNADFSVFQGGASPSTQKDGMSVQKDGHQASSRKDANCLRLRNLNAVPECPSIVVAIVPDKKGPPSMSFIMKKKGVCLSVCLSIGGAYDGTTNARFEFQIWIQTEPWFLRHGLRAGNIEPSSPYLLNPLLRTGELYFTIICQRLSNDVDYLPLLLLFRIGSYFFFKLIFLDQCVLNVLFIFLY